MNKLVFLGLVVMVYTQCMMANVEVNIVSASKGALVYVDGKQKGIIAKAPTQLSLVGGTHEIMVSHLLDEDWQEVERKNVTLTKKEQSVTFVFHLDLEKISKKSKRKNMSDAKSFVKSTDSVKDTTSGLLWQDSKDVVHLKQTWKEAKKYCEALTLNGKNDWRLPSYDELSSIVDYTKHTLAIMPAFSYILSADYWTSTEDSKDSKSIKNIYFGNGCPNAYPKTQKHYVRCVR